MENYSWPSPYSEPDYPVITKPLPRELIHAVGVIIIAWNDLEDIQLHLIREFLGFGTATGPGKFRIGSRVLDPMGNRQRSDLLRGLLSEYSMSEEVATTVLAFQTYYDICLGNRNLVAHSAYVEETEGAMISSYKATPHISFRYLPDDAEFWETTISEMKRVSTFGARIIDALYSRELGPLPDIPPPPRDLLKYLQVHRV